MSRQSGDECTAREARAFGEQGCAESGFPNADAGREARDGSSPSGSGADRLVALLSPPEACRGKHPEETILSAFTEARGTILKCALSCPEDDTIAPPSLRGIDGLRDAFAAILAEAGASDPGRLASRLSSLWLAAATTGTWDDHLAAAEALLDVSGFGPLSRREAELRRSEARYRAIFEDSPIRTMILTPDGRLSQVNRAWERAHGPFDEFPRDWNLLEDPQLIANGLLPQLTRGLAGEAMDLPAVPYLNRLAKPGEHPRWMQGSIFPIRDGASRVSELVINFGDVTESRQDAEVARGQAEVLARTLDALASGPDLDRFLGTVLEAMADQLRADSASLWFTSGIEDGVRLLMEYDAGVLRPASQSNHPDASRTKWAPTPQQVEFLEARRHDGVMVYEDIETAPIEELYRTYLIGKGIRSILLIYLFNGPDLVGIFSVRSKLKRRYHPEEIALAQALGRQATLAIQLTGLARQSRERAVLEERNRMAREIHDTLAQGLVAILIQLEAAEDARADHPSEAWGHVARARETARVGLDEARRSVQALRPVFLEQHDLAAALAKLVEEVAEDVRPEVRFDLIGTSRPLPQSVEDELFRIAQEALNNALRHSGAGRIVIRLEFRPLQVRLVIEDDGRGGAMTSNNQGGFGVIGMRERAEKLEASFSIEDAREGPLGRGTRVVVEVPGDAAGREAGLDE